jgi:peptidoglycan-N-acetylglucosamine deacetylase
MRASRRFGWLTWVGVTAVIGLLLGSGHVIGRMSSAVGTSPSPYSEGDAAHPGPGSSPIHLEAAPPPVRQAPITAPGRPPLPREKTGPFGSRVTTGLPDVALTFDDGPNPEWTPRILAVLREYRIKATFCLIGVNVVKFPQLVRDIVAEGHTLCNHSWVHDIGLGRRSPEWIMADLSRTSTAIRKAVPDAKISYYRQPGGVWTRAVVAAAAKLGMTSLHWQVDPQDWRKPGAYVISSKVIHATRPGSIVLMHDGGGNRSGTALALRSILPNLVARFPLEALPSGVDPPRLDEMDMPPHFGQT